MVVRHEHYVDLYGLQSMARYAPQGAVAPIPLYLPAGLFERMQLLLSERGAREFAEAFVPVPLVHGETVTVGGLTITPHLVQHTVPTFALIVEADGARLVYTADTAPCDGAFEAATGADLLLAEATLPEKFAGTSSHMTATQAGTLAREAGAGALVMVHVWPTNDREQMVALASQSFGGPVTVARELDEFEIAPR
jgi:phosphoribosyl 1,2-cyclic phosphodiesterase